MSDKITYPFPKFNSCTVDVWEWIHDFIPHFIMDVITYTYCDQSYIMLVKGGPGVKEVAHCVVVMFMGNIHMSLFVNCMHLINVYVETCICKYDRQKSPTYKCDEYKFTA